MQAQPTIVSLPPPGQTTSAPPPPETHQQGPTIVAIPPATKPPPPPQAPPPPPPPEEAGNDPVGEVTANMASASLGQDNNNNTNSNNNNNRDVVAEDFNNYSVATLSSPWEFDDQITFCGNCCVEFSPLNRKHHCRLCGKIFCNDCSNQRSLIPPSSIVLVPKGGKKVKKSQHQLAQQVNQISFNPDDDPDRMLTYVKSGGSSSVANSTAASAINIYNNNNNTNQQTNNNGGEELLYGKGLEERFKLAREPLRVCARCFEKLEPLQEELRCSNSNAMRFNHVDPTDPRRLFNSPLAFTLGHEVRKAAYTLNNLLPLPKRMGAFTDNNPYAGTVGTNTHCQAEMQHCKEECTGLSPNFQNMDGVQIPAKLLESAKGIAILTVAKGGFGFGGVEFGTGLVVARLGDNHWSAPSAIGTAGLSWGALIGAQVSDHVFLLMTDNAVEMMFSQNGSIQLGADVGVALGPVGRAFEADFGASGGNGNGQAAKAAPIYTYSFSKGFYAGVSLDGKVIVTRARVNEKFYGKEISSREILMGAIPTPPAAQPLYEALTRCHVYANAQANRQLRPLQTNNNMPNLITNPQYEQQQQNYQQQQQQMYQNEMEYGEFNPNMQQPQQPQFNNNNNNTMQQVYPPAADDQHSFSGGFSTISDLTSNTGARF